MSLKISLLKEELEAATKECDSGRIAESIGRHRRELGFERINAAQAALEKHGHEPFSTFPGTRWFLASHA